MATSRPVRHRRPLLSLLAICLLGSLLLTLPTATAGPTSSSAAPATALPVPELRWTDCGNGFQCATARVPLDYDKPRGSKISLADPASRR
jgi:hypothetical protein